MAILHRFYCTFLMENIHICMRGSSPGQSDKKKNSWHFFLVLSVKWSISKKSNVFQGYRGGPTFSRGGGGGGGGGSNFFQRGSNCLFPIETHITCDFPGEVRTPCPPPLWICTCIWHIFIMVAHSAYLYVTTKFLCRVKVQDQERPRSD